MEAGISKVVDGGITKYARCCPLCREQLTYTNYYNCKTAHDDESLCRSCSLIGNPSPHKIYQLGHVFRRSCPTCNTPLEYIHKTAYRRAEKLKSECKSCSKQGKKNPGHYNIGDLNVSRRPEVREKLRLSYLNQISKCYGQASPRYNPLACRLFDEINREMGWSGQHAENGGEYQVRGWFLDYYEPTENVVIEFDEPHHKRTKRLKKDIIKEAEVKEVLGCKFYRITPRDCDNWRNILSEV